MSGDSLEFIGFSLCGPEPLGKVHVPWSDGTTVLFGRNGAGKTKILNGLRQVVSGIAATSDARRRSVDRDIEIFFHVRLPDVTAPAHRRAISDPLAGSLLHVLDSAALETERAGFVDGFGAEERTLLMERARGGEGRNSRDWSGPLVAMLELLARARTVLQGLPDWPDWIDQVEQYREVASQGVLSLVAVGAQEPEWEIWISVVPGSAGPETRREIDDAMGRERLVEAWLEKLAPHDRVVYALLAWAVDLGAASEIALDEYRRRHADLRRLVGDSAVAQRVLHTSWPGRHFGKGEAREDIVALMEESPDSWWNMVERASLLGMVPMVDDAFREHVYQDLDDMDWRPIPAAASSGWFDAPSWVPVPLAPVAVGTLEGMPGLAFAAPDVASDPDRHSTSALRRMRRPPITLGELVDGHGSTVIDSATPARFAESARPYIALLQEEANQVVGQILSDLPEIRLRTGDVDDWLAGRAVVWEALDTPTGTWHGLEYLSAAQQRWITLGIDHAISRITAPDASESRHMMIVDEPELALRPTAARRVAEGLHRVARDTGSSVVLASHSVEFLGQPESVLFKVHRASDGLVATTRVSEFDHGALDDLADSLDLDFAEMLQLVDVFIFVEGKHDETAFGATIGQELTRLAARCVPMGGTFKVNAVLEGDMLLRATSAAIVVVFDNIHDPDALATAWAEAVEHAVASGPAVGVDHFKETLAELLPETERTKEDKEMIAFLYKTLESGNARRIFPYGVSKVDIEMYLPPEPFGIPAGTTWEQLWQEHNDLKGTKGVPNDFKKWLRDDRGIDVDSAGITRAAERLDAIPGDFTNLLSYVESVRQTTQRTIH